MKNQIQKILYINFLLLISLLIISCNKTVEPEQPNENKYSHYYFQAADYAEGFYFLDKVYFDSTNGTSIFSKVYNSNDPIDDDSISFYRIKNCQVWFAGATNLVYHQGNGTKISAKCFFDIKAKKFGNIYEKEYRENQFPSNEESWKYFFQHNFYLLNQGSDYEFDPYVGYIKLKHPIMNDEAIAVAYRIEGPTYEDYDDITYGEFLEDFVSNESVPGIMLKLIKPKNLTPDMKDAWMRMMKNIYRIPLLNNFVYGGEIQIEVKDQGGKYVNNFMNKTFNEYFDLDNKSASGENKPDGVIDFDTRNVKIDGNFIEIIFPKLFPFDEQFPKELPDTLRLNSLYTKTKSEFYRSSDKDKIQFCIKEYEK